MLAGIKVEDLSNLNLENPYIPRLGLEILKEYFDNLLVADGIIKTTTMCSLKIINDHISKDLIEDENSKNSDKITLKKPKESIEYTRMLSTKLAECLGFSDATDEYTIKLSWEYGSLLIEWGHKDTLSEGNRYWGSFVYTEDAPIDNYEEKEDCAKTDWTLKVFKK